MDPDLEKKTSSAPSVASVNDVNNGFYDEDLREPPAEETLHRGLKARQISMIAVRSSNALILSHPHFWH